MKALRNADGALTLPMILLMLAVMTGVIGTLKLMGRWRELARLQLRLDDCVRARVEELRDNLETVETHNARIRALRASVAATAAAPPANAAARQLLAAVAALQILQRVRWEADGLKWTLKRCSVGATVGVYPAFPWSTPPPDLLGPRPLAWAGLGRRCIRTFAFRLPRKALAELSRGEDGWSGQWRRPRDVFTGFCNETD